MKLIFGTTSERKKQDLQNIINELGFDIEIMSLDDIKWDRGEIDENGETIEENSLIKAYAIADFCEKHGINYPIITADAGLFVDEINGEPGIYTSRYADDELANDNTLPKWQCVYKLLRKLSGKENRKATYRCCVTVLLPDGTYYQEIGESKGSIANDIVGEIKKPYFYSVFILSGTNVPFSNLTYKQLKGTYRYQALRKSLKKFYNN